MFQINLKTQFKLYFSHIFLVIITTSILMYSNTGNLPFKRVLKILTLPFIFNKWTILIENLNWSRNFLANLFFQRLSWSWSLQAPDFLLELELELRVLDTNVGAKSGAAKFMFQINLKTQFKLYFSHIFLVIITTSILMYNNTGNLPFERVFKILTLPFILNKWTILIENLNWSRSFSANLFFQTWSWSWSFSAPIFLQSWSWSF